MENYYTAPINFATILAGEKSSCCNIHNSIQQFIDLIILTNLEEFRPNPTFGCNLWNSEFDVIPQETRWHGEIKKSIEEAIKKNEPRLESFEVTISIDAKSVSRKKVEFSVKGKIKLNGEPFSHSKIIYLCPRSID